MARIIPALTLILLAGTTPAPAQDEHFKKAGACGRCHVISVVEWGISRHAAASTDCIACHGVSEGHVIDERNNIKPERIPRGAASASLCAGCHSGGCPKTKQTAACGTCHHFHALLNPSKPPPANDERTDRIAAAWRDSDRRIAAGERLAALGQWEKARAEFHAALVTRPTDARAKAGLALCQRRLSPALPGFDVQGSGTDAASGLPRNVRVADLAIEMVFVPAGHALIGAGQFRESSPVHSVEMEAFYLGKFEVTASEWASVMGSPAPAPASAMLPVANITWDEAVEFVRRVNLRVPGAGFRLPTEAEWEYAARAGRVGAAAAAAAAAAAEIPPDLAWFNAPRDKRRPRPAAEGQPDKLGLYNMSGNVWEWCSSRLAPYPYRPGDGRESMTGGGLRILRGGGFLDTSDLLHPALRHSERPSRRLPYNGLRLARGVPPPGGALQSPSSVAPH